MPITIASESFDELTLICVLMRSGGWDKKSVAFACVVVNNKTFKTEVVAINQLNVAQ